MLKFPMDSHFCPLSFSSFLDFWGSKVMLGSFFFSSLSFTFLLSWCQVFPGPPNSCPSPFLLTVLCCSTWASCWIPPSSFHSISSLLPTTEVYLMYVCSSPSLLSLIWIGFCHLPLGFCNIFTLKLNMSKTKYFVYSQPLPPKQKCCSCVLTYLIELHHHPLSC